MLCERKVHWSTRKLEILLTPDCWSSSDVPVRMHAHTSEMGRKRVMAGFIRYLSNVSDWLVRKVRECVCGRAAHNRGDQISQLIRCSQNMK
jgi:hypothetical protein